MTEKPSDLSSDVVIVDGLQESYLPAIAVLYDEAFSAKFSWAISSKERRIQLWSELIRAEQVIGAVSDSELLGVLLYSLPSSSGWRREGAIRSIFKSLLLSEALRTLLVFALFEKASPKSHLYVEAISVSSKARGLGVGSMLLDAASKRSRLTKLQGLQLRVILENPRAKALYERAGFATIKTELAGPFGKLIGLSGADLMQRDFIENRADK
ncbi:MAG: GNAT family N-acetyltransferase [Actinobacteria bacterium]|nr:GNAT family N-acetyltransferase [Actinomycetota bacterium]